MSLSLPTGTPAFCHHPRNFAVLSRSPSEGPQGVREKTMSHIPRPWWLLHSLTPTSCHSWARHNCWKSLSVILSSNLDSVLCCKVKIPVFLFVAILQVLDGCKESQDWKFEDSFREYLIYVPLRQNWGLLWQHSGKESPASSGEAGDVGLIPGSGRSLGVENDNPLQYFCLENSMDRGAWQTTVHGVTKSRACTCTHVCTHTQDKSEVIHNHPPTHTHTYLCSPQWTLSSKLLENSTNLSVSFFVILCHMYLHFMCAHVPAHEQVCVCINSSKSGTVIKIF